MRVILSVKEETAIEESVSAVTEGTMVQKVVLSMKKETTVENGVLSAEEKVHHVPKEKEREEWLRKLLQLLSKL